MASPTAVTPHWFLDCLMVLRARFSFSCSSYLRSPKHNAAVGGSDSSFHMVFLAVDITIDDRSETPEFVKLAERLGLQVLVHDTYLHLEPRI